MLISLNDRFFIGNDVRLKKEKLYLKINNQDEISYFNKILLDNKIKFLCIGLLKPDLEEIFINIMNENKEGEGIWQ